MFHSHNLEFILLYGHVLIKSDRDAFMLCINRYLVL